MKRRIFEWLSSVVITMLSACPLTTSAQTMTLEKAKQAGVILLADKDWAPFKATGNMIYLRLDDKTRPKHKKNEIMIHEVDCRTQKQERYMVTIDKENFGLDNEDISVLRFRTPLNERDFIISNESKGLFFCSSRNIDEDFRQYEIKMVLFYKNFEDVIAGCVLGEEYDLERAYYYIKEMFKPYQK